MIEKAMKTRPFREEEEKRVVPIRHLGYSGLPHKPVGCCVSMVFPFEQIYLSFQQNLDLEEEGESSISLVAIKRLHSPSPGLWRSSSTGKRKKWNLMDGEDCHLQWSDSN
jgi:hypothetical protein